MPKRKVLLVDDEIDFVRVMGTRIREWGYEVIESSGGSEALAALKEKKPDIMILDYKMPKMDGVATLERIRKVNRRIPVVLFTAYSGEVPLKTSEKLGITAFVPKLSAYSDPQNNLKSAIKIAEKGLKKRSMKRRV